MPTHPHRRLIWRSRCPHPHATGRSSVHDATHPPQASDLGSDARISSGRRAWRSRCRRIHHRPDLGVHDAHASAATGLAFAQMPTHPPPELIWRSRCPHPPRADSAFTMPTHPPQADLAFTMPTHPPQADFGVHDADAPATGSVWRLLMPAHPTPKTQKAEFSVHGPDASSTG